MPAQDSLQTLESAGDRLGPAIEKQFETFCRSLMRGPGTTQDPGYCRLITGEPHPLGNFAVVSDPTDPEQAARAIEPLRALAAPSAVIFVGTPTEEVAAFVEACGYALAESMPAMAVDIDRLARPELPPGHEFTRIDPERHREAWNDALAAGYELPRPVAEHFGPGRLEASADVTAHYYAVKTGDEFVATSMLFLEGGFAGIYCVATLPEHRGKGLGAYVTAEPLHRVREQGYRVGILQSSAMGEPVYERIGFEQHGIMPLYVRMPADDG